MNALIARYATLKNLGTSTYEELEIAFGSIEDLTDSALKILIPMLQAYSEIDNDAENIVRFSITENSKVRIVIDCPIILNPLTIV